MFFEKVEHTTCLRHKIKFYCIYGKMFFLIELLISSRRLWVVLKYKSSCYCFINSEMRINSILIHLLFFYLNCFPDNVLCKMCEILCSHVIKWQTIWFVDSLWVVIWPLKSKVLENISTFSFWSVKIWYLKLSVKLKH